MISGSIHNMGGVAMDQKKIGILYGLIGFLLLLPIQFKLEILYIQNSIWLSNTFDMKKGREKAL